MPPVTGVQVTLGGEKRSLRFTNEAIVMLEDETGMTLNTLTNRAAAGSVKAYAQLFWSALLHQEPKLTVGQVVSWLELPKIAEYAEAIAKAVNMAYGEDETDGDEGEPAEGKAPAAH